MKIQQKITKIALLILVCFSTIFFTTSCITYKTLLPGRLIIASFSIDDVETVRLTFAIKGRNGEDSTLFISREKIKLIRNEVNNFYKLVDENIIKEPEEKILNSNINEISFHFYKYGEISKLNFDLISIHFDIQRDFNKTSIPLISFLGNTIPMHGQFKDGLYFDYEKVKPGIDSLVAKAIKLK